MVASFSVTDLPDRPQIAAVAFDLDGTLVDSRADLASAVNAVRREIDLPPLGLERVVGMVGKGARRLVRRALPEEIDGEDFERAFGRFLDLYYDRCVDATRPYPGIEAMLAALAAFEAADEPLSLAVVTNKPERHTAKVLGGLGLERRFPVVLGGDSLSERKPDPAPLLEAARRLRVPAGRLLFVGDSETDGETARRAGSPLALVTWGFGSREELAGFDCVLRPEAPDELVAWVHARRAVGRA